MNVTVFQDSCLKEMCRLILNSNLWFKVHTPRFLKNEMGANFKVKTVQDSPHLSHMALALKRLS